jgi:hypothetical protein
MAQDLHGDTILHSLYGRKLGLDPNGLLTGHPDNKYGTERITSTSPSTLAGAGTSILQATGAAAYELVPPSAMMLGVRKRLFNNSTGAVAQLAKLTVGNFVSLLGSSHTTLSLTTRGAYVDLEYISTALVAIALQTTSSAISNVSLTTTT